MEEDRKRVLRVPREENRALINIYVVLSPCLK